MGKNKVVQCNICSKEMRSDNLKRHLSQHRDTSAYPSKKCSICSKVMIGWNLKRHLKTHSETMKSISESVQGDQKIYDEKKEAGGIVKKLLEEGNINPHSLSKNNLKALQVYSMETIMWKMAALNRWQTHLLELMKPSERKIIWVKGETGGEGKTWFQNYIVHHYGIDRVFQSPINKNSESIFHALSKRTLELVDVFVFNVPRSFKTLDIPYTLFEDIKDGQAISTKYDSKLLNFKTPNILIIFSNRIASWANMSNDRWIKINLLKEDDGFVIKMG